jgi:hypothetical protein
MEEHYLKLIKKQSRLKKQQKRTVAKTSATLAGQHLRTAAAKGYSLPKANVIVKFKK